jgi:hypothetical protein
MVTSAGRAAVEAATDALGAELGAPALGDAAVEAATDALGAPALDEAAGDELQAAEARPTTSSPTTALAAIGRRDGKSVDIRVFSSVTDDTDAPSFFDLGGALKGHMAQF